MSYVPESPNPFIPPEPVTPSTGASAKGKDGTEKATEDTTDKVTQFLHSQGKSSANPPYRKIPRPPPVAEGPVQGQEVLDLTRPPTNISKNVILEDITGKGKYSLEQEDDDINKQ